MSREEDYKILCWVKPEIIGKLCPQFIPKYSEYNADAITLLPVLVEKGYGVRLQDTCAERGLWEFGIWKDPLECIDYKGVEKTIASAITTAVLSLIEREEKQ